VPKQEIVENDYDLSINKYKKVEYKPVQYPPTEEILRTIDDLEADIQRELAELKSMLSQSN
jgi:type I restriction enzyme M protein